MHLIVNPNPTSPCSRSMKWFIGGWNGYTFQVNENAVVVPLPINEDSWRSSVMREQMWANCSLINASIGFSGGICNWIEDAINRGEIMWVEDTDSVLSEDRENL